MPHWIPLVIWLGACLALFVAAFEWPFGSVPRYRSERWHTVIAAGTGVFAACSALEFTDLSQGRVLLVHRLQIAAGALAVFAWLRYARVQAATPPSAVERLLERCALVVVPLSLLGLLQTGALTPSPAGLGPRFWLINCNPLGEASYAVLLLGMALALRRFIQAVRAGVPHAWPHTLALGTMLAAGINDALGTVGVRTVPYLLTIGLFGEVVALGIVAARRWAHDARRAAELSATLELQVEARTRELQAVHSALERSARLVVLGRLASGVAHEINNPAAAISVCLDFLREAHQDGRLSSPEVLESINDASAAVGRIAHIVRELLASAPAAADATGVSLDVDASLQRAARKAGLTPGVSSRAQIESRDCRGMRAMGEPDLLEQVLVNLAINGAQAIQPGRHGQVALWSERRGGRVLIHVTDDGAGISDEARAHFCEPFFSTRPFGEGTGLGLSVALGMVRGMGGDLSVDTLPGRGTTVTVSLRAA